MTVARRTRKRAIGSDLPGIVLASGVLIGTTALRAAATTERIVVDRHTGLAIHGFDPVAYFTDAKASNRTRGTGTVARRRGLALSQPGNRAAFAEHPDIYMPRFGGYDPVALARGVATPGHPHLWLIADDRLYLFHSLDAQSAFAADPRRRRRGGASGWTGGPGTPPALKGRRLNGRNAARPRASPHARNPGIRRSCSTCP